MVQDVNGVGCRSRWRSNGRHEPVDSLFKGGVEERGGGMLEAPIADSCMGRVAVGGGGDGDSGSPFRFPLDVVWRRMRVWQSSHGRRQRASGRGGGRGDWEHDADDGKGCSDQAPARRS
jgi:hypothetical protein